MNEKVISDGMKKADALIRNRVLSALKRTAFDLTALTNVPVWTHNLWDSIGCGVYENGVLVEFSVPAQVATEPRSGADDYAGTRKSSASSRPLWNVPSGVDRDRAWWGTHELLDMLTDPPLDIVMHQGYALYYVAAMPYAEIQDRYQNVTHENRMQPIFFQHIRTFTK